MKKVLLICTVILFALTVKGQSQSKDATFCGKIGEGGPAGGVYTLAELQNCDFKIIPLDSNFTVTEFRLTLVASDKSNQNQEEKIKGNEIPKEFRIRMLTQTKNAFLEYIKAVNKEGKLIGIKPIGVRIQS